MKNKDRFRFMIEKLTELNTNSITIGKTEYSQKVNIKKEKINSWIISSVEQSGTPFIPKIDIVERLDFNFFNHALDIKGKEISTNINQKNIAIGPEGGWSEAELSKLTGLDEENKIKTVHIYPNNSKVYNPAFDITPSKFIKYSSFAKETFPKFKNFEIFLRFISVNSSQEIK